MVITGLLLIAGICLGLGLAVPSALWLLASLVATAAAGFLVYRMRSLPAARQQSAPIEGSGPAAAAGTEPAADGAGVDEPAARRAGTDAGQVWVVHGWPRYHLGGCAVITAEDAETISFEQATDDGFVPCSMCEAGTARTT